MDERVRSDRIAPWALATFHAALLVVLLALASYRSGSLGESLADIGTGAGLALFLSLWGISFGAHVGWLRR